MTTFPFRFRMLWRSVGPDLFRSAPPPELVGRRGSADNMGCGASAEKGRPLDGVSPLEKPNRTSNGPTVDPRSSAAKRAEANRREGVSDETTEGIHAAARASQLEVQAQGKMQGHFSQTEFPEVWPEEP